MQIYFNQLEKQLNSLSPAYLVASDDILLQQDACDSIKKAAKSQGYEEVERHHVEKNFDWNTWSGDSSALSLFANLRVIQLTLSSSKIGTEGSNAIQAFLEHQSDDTILLISSPRIEGKPKWVKALSEQGTYVPVYPLEPDQLPQWLQQRAKRFNFSLTPDAARSLAEKVEGNLMSAVQELEKLSLLHEEGTIIDAESIESSVSDNARFSVFSMLDHVMAGNAIAGCRALRHIREEGEEPLAIVGATAYQLRNLITLKKFQQENNLGKGYSSLRIIQKRQHVITKALSRLNETNLKHCLQLAEKADQMSKRSEKQLAWNTLESILLILSGKKLILDEEKSSAQHFPFNHFLNSQ